MKLALILGICSLTLESQSLKPTRTYNGYQPNSGQLYFTDNVQASIQTVNDNLRAESDSKTSTAQTQAQTDSYVLAQQIQQQKEAPNDSQTKILSNPAIPRPITSNENEFHGNQFLIQNQNVNQFQPSRNLLPPKDSSPDYYGAKQGGGQLKTQAEAISADDRFSTGSNAAPGRNNVTQQDMTLASLTISHIGIFMMKNVQRNQSNTVISPLSVVNMLALLQAGATGETQRQISNALQLTPEMSAGIFRLMNTNLAKRSIQRNVLRTASSIFAADAFALNTPFKNIAIQDFGSEVSKISFQNSVAAAQKINSWISSKTNNKIDKVVSPDSLGVNTQLVLANAVYFKGLWETIFSAEATTEKDFYLSNGQKKRAKFMSLRNGFRCGVDKNINSLVVVLPFEAKEYSLIILLPLPNTNVRDVLSSLTGDILLGYQNIRVQDVLLEIPKFVVRANTDLEPVFIKMGISKMFSGASELNNIGLYRTSSPQVSSAIHSAMMSIDERGATAAASTVVAAVALSYDNPSIVFTADRSFLTVLWDNQLNMPLFMTQIEDPSL